MNYSRSAAIGTWRVIVVFLGLIGTACETSEPRIGRNVVVSGAEDRLSDAEPVSLRWSTEERKETGAQVHVEDGVVARLGEWSLRKSDVYDHLADQDPDQVRAALAVMLSQRVVTKRSRDLGIRIDDEVLRVWFAGHLAQLTKRVALDYGKSVTLERYLHVTYGQSVDQYQRIVVDRERDFRLMARVVRYAQITEDRVRLRLLSVPDRLEAKRIHRKLSEGADFGRLARQTSSHSSRDSGGQVEPMWVSSLNVSLKEAVIGLKVGQTSGVVDSRDELGRRQFFVVKLMERIAGRDEPYSELKDAIEADLAKRPLATAEFVMWQARINNQVELVPAVR